MLLETFSVRQTARLAKTLAKNWPGRGSGAVVSLICSSLEGLPGHSAEREKALLHLHVSLPLT